MSSSLVDQKSDEAATGKIQVSPWLFMLEAQVRILSLTSSVSRSTHVPMTALP